MNNGTKKLQKNKLGSPGQKRDTLTTKHAFFFIIAGVKNWKDYFISCSVDPQCCWNGSQNCAW